jgi:hypothetical protein
MFASVPALVGCCLQHSAQKHSIFPCSCSTLRSCRLLCIILLLSLLSRLSSFLSHHTGHHRQVEIVFTAHPTEVNRLTMISFHDRIRQMLDRLDEPSLSSFERRQAENRLAGQVCVSVCQCVSMSANCGCLPTCMSVCMCE